MCPVLFARKKNACQHRQTADRAGCDLQGGAKVPWNQGNGSLNGHGCLLNVPYADMEYRGPCQTKTFAAYMQVRQDSECFCYIRSPTDSHNEPTLLAQRPFFIVSFKASEPLDLYFPLSKYIPVARLSPEQIPYL
jgi:hypothetical protein